jgi:hypothetical protein
LADVPAPTVISQEYAPVWQKSKRLL